MNHDWQENSGTTDRCANCGVLRYWEDSRGNPSRRSGVKVTYGFDWNKAKDAPPPCEAKK